MDLEIVRKERFKHCILLHSSLVIILCSLALIHITKLTDTLIYIYNAKAVDLNAKLQTLRHLVTSVPVVMLAFRLFFFIAA